MLEDAGFDRVSEMIGESVGDEELREMGIEKEGHLVRLLFYLGRADGIDSPLRRAFDSDVSDAVVASHEGERRSNLAGGESGENFVERDDQPRRPRRSEFGRVPIASSSIVDHPAHPTRSHHNY